MTNWVVRIGSHFMTYPSSQNVYTPVVGMRLRFDRQEYDRLRKLGMFGRDEYFYGDTARDGVVYTVSSVSEYAAHSSYLNGVDYSIRLEEHGTTMFPHCIFRMPYDLSF